MLNQKPKSAIALIAALAVCLLMILPAFAAQVKEPGAYVKKKIASCRAKSKAFTMDQVKDVLGKPGWLIIDCRTEKEFKKGHLPGAINIPRGKLEFMVEKKVKDYNAKVVVYCKAGGRACLAVCTMLDMGYSKVFGMTKGFKDWVKADYPIG